MLPSVIPKVGSMQSTIDVHRFRIHQNCKIDIARFEEGKRPSRRRNSRPHTPRASDCFGLAYLERHLVTRFRRPTGAAHAKTGAEVLESASARLPARHRELPSSAPVAETPAAVLAALLSDGGLLLWRGLRW